MGGTLARFGAVKPNVAVPMTIIRGCGDHQRQPYWNVIRLQGQPAIGWTVSGNNVNLTRTA